MHRVTDLADKFGSINCTKYIQNKRSVTLNRGRKQEGIGSDLAAINVHWQWRKTTQTLYRVSAAHHTTPEHMRYIQQQKLINLNASPNQVYKLKTADEKDPSMSDLPKTLNSYAPKV